MPDAQKIFSIFREVGIVHQLTTALLQRVLPDGLHPTHFGTLSHLVNGGDGRPPVQIANAMQVPKNSMTNTLQVLEAKGFIEFVANPKDKRSKIVQLTSSGRDFFVQAQSTLRKTYGPLIARLEGLDEDRLLDELQKLRRHLDDNRES